MTLPYYFTDLFQPPTPASDIALTVHGLISGGVVRFPTEWAAVERDRKAIAALFAYIAEAADGSDDGMLAPMRHKMLCIASRRLPS